MATGSKNPGRVALILPLLGAASCTLSVDSEQSRLCRAALPALEPAGTRLEVARIAALDVGRLRIDYRASGDDGAGPTARFAICRFGPSTLAPGRVELAGIATERGEIAGASLFLLKRYYLESPDSVGPTPGVVAGADLPDMPRPLALAVQQALASWPRTAIYGLLAAAYALVYGLVGRINIAFGEIATVGAAALGLAVVGVSQGQLTAPAAAIALGLVLAILAASIHNAVAGWVAFGAIPAGRGQASLIATVGLSLALSEYLRLAGGAVPNWVPPLWSEPIPLGRAGNFVVVATPVSLLTGATGLAAALLLLGLMSRTRFGRNWRAAAEDPLAAALCGIDGRRLLLLTLALSGSLAGLAGGLVAVQYGALGFAGGFSLGLKALAAAILGGIGSVPGALAGGLAIGIFETAAGRP